MYLISSHWGFQGGQKIVAGRSSSRSGGSRNYGGYSVDVWRGCFEGSEERSRVYLWNGWLKRSGG